MVCRSTIHFFIMDVARARPFRASYSTPAMDLSQKAANLPLDAGVYLFKDVLGNILYVGKSRSIALAKSIYFPSNPVAGMHELVRWWRS